jgi:hypothetical protein
MKWHRILRKLVGLFVVLWFLAGCSAAVAPGTSAGEPAPAVSEPTESASGFPEATPLPTAAPTALPILTESRRLNLEWPPRLREGDSGVVKLVLEVDDQGNLTPTAEVEGNVVRSQTVEIQNLYDTHNVVAEARLDMAGVIVLPEGDVSEPLRPGQSATFFWNIRTPHVGHYKGTVWLHLRFIPIDGDGPESRTMVSAQVIDVETVNFLGLGGTPARLLGGAGALLGSVLGLDNVIPYLWGWIRKKSRSRSG